MDIAEHIRLLRHIIKAKGSLCISVEGYSMIPTIYPKTRVILKEIKKPVKGEIVVFYNGGQKIIHRIYKQKDSDYFITKGDSVFILDPPVFSGDILGVVNEVKHTSKIKKINTPLARNIWKIVMPIQVFIGKSKRFIPLKIQKKLKDILTSLSIAIMKRR